MEREDCDKTDALDKIRRCEALRLCVVLLLSGERVDSVEDIAERAGVLKSNDSDNDSRLRELERELEQESLAEGGCSPAHIFIRAGRAFRRLCVADGDNEASWGIN